MGKIGKRLTDAETERVRTMAAYIDASPHEWPNGVADIALLCHGFLDQQATIADLERRLAEARRDGERLDHMEQERIAVYPGMPKQKHDYWFVRTYDGKPTRDGKPTLREAIDDSIDAARGGAK